MKFINNLIIQILPFLPKFLVKIVASPYIAGITDEEMLQNVEKLNRKGFKVAIDILGEHVKTENEAEEITKRYSRIYDEINKRNLLANISIKLTHIGQDLGIDIVRNNLSKLVEAAIVEQLGILFLIASFASIVSAFGQVRLHIPIGAKPNGKPYSESRSLVFRDLSSTFINTLGSSLIFSYALLLLIDRNSFPEAPSTKSKTSFGNRHFAISLASSILKIF